MVNDLVVSESVLINSLSEHEEELKKQWSEALPGSEEQERIHKQLMEVSRIKKEVILHASDEENSKEQNKKHRKEFWINTGLNVVKIVLPAGLSVALLRYSSKGGYMSGDEAKAFGWLFGMANQK